MTEIPLTIEEFLEYGNFSKTTRRAIMQEVTEVILRKRMLERQALLHTCIKPGFFSRLTNR